MEEENKPGKRLAEGTGMSPAAKRGLIIVAAVVAALCAVYVALCAWVVSSVTVLPRVSAAGVALGGMDRAQAAEALSRSAAMPFAGTSVSLVYGDETMTIPGDVVEIDADETARQALIYGRANGFLGGGGHVLAALVTGPQVTPVVRLSDAGEAQVEQAVEQIADALGGNLKETTWAVEGDQLVFYMGTPGTGVDRAALREDILARIVDGDETPYTVAPATTDPSPVNLDAVHSQVYAEVKEASLDRETFEVTDSVTGLDFDVDAAARALEGAAWGSEVSIPLIVTEPKVSGESLRELLFRDLLGEASSKVSGSAARRSNVKLAASTYNDYILLPGEVFSYNTTTGSRTADKGYQAAPVYKGGKSVDEVGGGICQPSSTLYYATLNANLKIVERHNHQFAVGYVPDGLDATVYFGSLDFQFENDTDYPIKITETYENNRLTVQIWGTKTDELTVKMDSQSYDYVAYTTKYEIDPNMAPGSAPKEAQNGYTGRKATTYRNLYDKDGNLVSSTLETTNKYNVRERILLVSPADAAQYGLAADGTPLPSAPVDTAAPTTPAETPAGTEPPPGVPETPAPTEGDGLTGDEEVPPTAPAESTPPAESAVPEAPAEPSAPAESQPPAEDPNAPPPGIPID